MEVTIAHAPDLEGCVDQLQAGEEAPYRLVIFFASPRHDQGEVSARLHQTFATATVIGCSTAGEVSSGRMTDGAIVAMGIPAAVVRDVAVAAIEDLSAPEAVEKAVEELGRKLGRPVPALDLKTHVGLVLVDGMSRGEEKLMEKLGDLADLHFIGGSAGDDLAFERTTVSCDGRVYAHGAVLAVLEAPNGYEIVKTQSFVATGKHLTATKVDEAARMVVEFDGEPANVAYARALGVPVGELAGQFMDHPLGLMVNGEPFVRSPQHVTGKGAIVFYCNVLEGMELEILESVDIIGDTANALAAGQARLGPVAGLLNFNCILRTLELKAHDWCEEYGMVFAEIPTAGFSTYGEEYIGHINQTATMLLFGGPAV